MKITHSELDSRERRIIEDMLNAKMPLSKIATEIGRYRATVYREIRWNRYLDDELPKLTSCYGTTARRTAADRRARRRKLVRLLDLRTHVIRQLEKGCAPEQIAGRLPYDGQAVRVSHDAIYACV